MTVSEKHTAAAIDLVDSETFKGLMAVDRIGKCAEMVAEALAAAEREGREDERKRCAVLCEHFAQQWDTGGINGKPNDGFNACMQVHDAILSQANTHSVAPPPPGATEAGSVQPSADPATHNRPQVSPFPADEAGADCRPRPATHHASRNGEGA